MHPMLFGTTNNYGVYTLKQHDLSFPNIFLVLKSSNFNYLKSSYGPYDMVTISVLFLCQTVRILVSEIQNIKGISKLLYTIPSLVIYKIRNIHHGYVVLHADQESRDGDGRPGTEADG